MKPTLPPRIPSGLGNAEAIELYKELGDYERHFNRIQSYYRGLASTWLGAVFTGIGFLYYKELQEKLPVNLEIAAALVALAGGTGIALIWLLDVRAYHRLLTAVTLTAEHCEIGFRPRSIPGIREEMRRRTQDLNVRTIVSIFYSFPMILLLLMAGSFLGVSISGNAEAIRNYPLLTAMGLWFFALLGLSFFLRKERRSKGRRKLVVVCGLPGSGKTETAKRVLQLHLSGVDKSGFLLRTDVIRTEIEVRSGYEDESRAAVYKEMFDRAEQELGDRTMVILDGTFKEQGRRDEAFALAERSGADLILVHVICDEDEIIRERLSKRRKDESEADYNTFLRHREQWEPILSSHVAIDNSGTMNDLDREIRAWAWSA